VLAQYCNAFTERVLMRDMITPPPLPNPTERIKGSAEWKQLTQGTSTSPLGPGHAQLERAASHASPEGLRLKGGAPRSSRPTTPLRGNTAKRDSVRAGAVRPKLAQVLMRADSKTLVDGRMPAETPAAKERTG